MEAQTPRVAPAHEKAKKSPLPNDKKTVEQDDLRRIDSIAAHCDVCSA
jgi:predicted flap endonuclease-1-like 5' DNA nuclease